MNRVSTELRIKLAIVAILVVAALGMYIWKQDTDEWRPVVSAGPVQPTVTPVPYVTPFTGYGY